MLFSVLSQQLNPHLMCQRVLGYSQPLNFSFVWIRSIILVPGIFFFFWQIDLFLIHQRFEEVYVCMYGPIRTDQMKCCVVLEKVSQGMREPSAYSLILKFIGYIKKINE